jgi:non-ribosomal peptide synthetase component F
VAICAERSVDMAVAMLAVLALVAILAVVAILVLAVVALLAVVAMVKAGAAYVPLDPAYPAGRLAHMVRGSDPALLLPQSRIRPSLPSGSLPMFRLDIDQPTRRHLLHDTRSRRSRVRHLHLRLDRPAQGCRTDMAEHGQT